MRHKKIRHKLIPQHVLQATCALLAIVTLSWNATAQVSDYDRDQQDSTEVGPTEDALGRKDLRLLGLRDAIVSTLENNLDIAVARITPQIAALDITVAKAAFDPVFSADSKTRGMDVPAPNFNGNDWQIITGRRTNTTTIDTDISKKTVTGAEMHVTWDYYRQNTTNPTTSATGRYTGSFNPTYTSDLVFTLDQPLLRGAGIDYNRSTIKIAMMNKKMYKEDFEWKVMTSARDVQKIYWAFVGSISNLRNKRAALERVKKILSDNRARLKVGQMARADVVQSEAEVAQAQQDVITAEYSTNFGVRFTENALKEIINDPDFSITSDTAIVPSDRPTSEPREIDWVYCVDRALNLRPDFARIKSDLEKNKIQIKQRKNELYPQVDLETSLTLNGLGDSFYWAADVMSPFHSHNYFDAYIGMKVVMPLGGNRAAKARYEQAQLYAAQKLRELKNKELDIVREVRDIVTAVKGFLKVHEAAETLVELRQRQLEAKEIKIKAGTGIMSDVVDAQEKLVAAEASELASLISYNSALADLSCSMGTILDELDVEIEDTPDER